MKSDVTADAAKQDGENPKGEPGRNQIPPCGHVECGEHEQDKSKNKQDN
jgi:hypothetical protein